MSSWTFEYHRYRTFFGQRTSRKKLEDWATILGTMVSTVVAIIGGWQSFVQLLVQLQRYLQNLQQ
jgi:hypothetical protein